MLKGFTVMSKALLKCFLFLSACTVFLFAPSSFASQAIVCFHGNFQEDYFADGDLSAIGAKKVKFIRTVDSWMADLTGTNFGLNGLSAQEFYEEMWERLRLSTPDFYRAIACVKNHSSFLKGTAVNKELPLINDMALPFGIPKECSVRQIVTQANGEGHNQYFYNAALLSRVKDDVPSIALLQLHEDFYLAAKEAYGHIDSARIRNLIGALMHGPSAEELEIPPYPTGNYRRDEAKKTLKTFGPRLRSLCP